MTLKSATTLLALVPLFAVTSAMVDTLNNPANQVASNDAPCTPSTTANVISGARSLLSIARSVLDTKASLSDNRLEQVQAARNVNKGENVINNVEKLAGGTPCS